jgi:hypothetical protein
MSNLIANFVILVYPLDKLAIIKHHDFGGKDCMTYDVKRLSAQDDHDADQGELSV